MNFNLLNLYALTTSPADIWFVVSLFSYSLLIANRSHTSTTVHCTLFMFHVLFTIKAYSFGIGFSSNFMKQFNEQNKKNSLYCFWSGSFYDIFPLLVGSIFCLFQRIVQQIASENVKRSLLLWLQTENKTKSTANG